MLGAEAGKMRDLATCLGVVMRRLNCKTQENINILGILALRTEAISVISSLAERETFSQYRFDQAVLEERREIGTSIITTI